MAAVDNLQRANDAGVNDVIYVDRNGHFTEGPTWNFFSVIDGKITCAKNQNILTGITTLFVNEAAQQLGIEIVERDVHVDELPQMSESFGTSTTKGVVPIVEINGIKIGDGQVGDVVKKLMHLLDEKIKQL